MEKSNTSEWLHLGNNFIGSVEEQAIHPVVSLHNIVVKVQNNLTSFVLIAAVPETIQKQPNCGLFGFCVVFR